MKRIMFKILAVIFCCALTVSCDDSVSFGVTDIRLLESKKIFSTSNSEVTAVGMIMVSIRSNIDLISFAKTNEYNLWYNIKDCDEGYELSRWPVIYRPSSDGEQTVYEILFDYKSPKNHSRAYDLSTAPANLCIAIVAGSMNPFAGSRSDEVIVPLTQEFVDVLARYSTSDGPIELELSEKCKSNMCIPDYAM